MGVRQVYRGDPEEKRFYLTENFIGGIDNINADDIVSDRSFRNLVNMQGDIQGVLTNRRGIKPYDSLDTLLVKALGRKIPTYTRYIKILNDNDKLLEDYFRIYDNLDTLIEKADGRTLTFITAYDEEINSVMYGFIDFIKITVENDDITVISKKQALPDNRSVDSINFLEIGTEIIIRCANQLITKMVLGTDGYPVYTFYNIAKNSQQYLVYKPTPLEVRKIGFNVLAYSPLTFIDKQGITEKSIQGIYITTVANAPILSLPLNSKFKLFIMYTGTISSFDVAFKDGDNTLTATVTKDNVLSTGGLLVYDVVFSDIYVTQVEINVSVTGDTSVGTYRDYYPIDSNTINRTNKVVAGLDISNFYNISHFGRVVYYKGKEIWFSEINKFDYVPNYNYVVLDINYDDEIMSINFFRNSYIIFTKYRIFKMTGAFGSSEFRIDLINDYVGCVNRDTIRYIENSLVFLSDFGLYRLKSIIASTNPLENVEKLDVKINLNLNPELKMYSFLYNNKYILFYGDKALIYVYEEGNFIYNEFKVTYDILFFSNGKIYFLNDGSILQYDAEGYYKDGTSTITNKIQTVSNNLEYPAHNKSIKAVIIKMKHGSKLVPVYVTLYANGYLRYSPNNCTAIINEKREVEYIETTDPTLRLAANKIILGQAKLGDNKLGGTDFTVHKLNYPSKCKNVYLYIEIESDSSFSLHSIGYIYKLGKVKE